MKKITLIFTLLLVMSIAKAQQINWANYSTSKENLVYLSTGLDYGFTGTLGYGHYAHFYVPFLISADFGIPLGNDLLDDVKLRAGIQVELFETHNFHFIGKYYLVSKRYETNLTMQYAFGNELGLTAGFFKPKWHVAGEFNYDHVSISHIKHLDDYLAFYPEAKDGWYENAAGNFQYGIQGGYSFNRIDLNLRVGMSNKQKFENNTIPYYAVLGANFRFSRAKSNP